jgi:two-component system response regulator VicR
MGKKILVVDDEPHIVKLLSSRLKANGFEVVEAYNGLQAVRLAFTEKPALILLDVRMPDGGGFAVFENLKVSEVTCKIPVIFMTADLEEETREKALDLGPEYFLNKPFNPEELLAKIETVLERIDREGR